MSSEVDWPSHRHILSSAIRLKVRFLPYLCCEPQTRCPLNTKPAVPPRNPASVPIDERCPVDPNHLCTRTCWWLPHVLSPDCTLASHLLSVFLARLPIVQVLQLEAIYYASVVLLEVPSGWFMIALVAVPRF